MAEKNCSVVYDQRALRPCDKQASADRAPGGRSQEMGLLLMSKGSLAPANSAKIAEVRGLPLCLGRGRHKGLFLLASPMSSLSELQEARTLLEKAELESDPLKKAKAMHEAIALLDSYRERHESLPDNEKHVIANLRRSYTRRLLSQLHTLMNIRMEKWFEYIRLFVN